MQNKQSLYPAAIALFAAALGFAAGVHSTSSPANVEAAHFSAVELPQAPADAFVYFPSHFVNRAENIEHLPEQF